MIDVKEHVYDDDPLQGHPDVKTQLKATDYFFLGNGSIQAAIQAAGGGEGTPLGLLLMDPEYLQKKREALSQDSKTGLEETQVRLHFGSKIFTACHDKLDVFWSFQNRVPSVCALWGTDAFQVEEEFFCPWKHKPALVRNILVKNITDQIVSVLVETGLLQQKLKTEVKIEPEASASIGIKYTLSSSEQQVYIEFTDDISPHPDLKSFWQSKAKAKFSTAPLDHFFRSACFQLPAVISAAGTVDASIWQYNREWVRDHAWMSVGLLLSGHHERASVLLERLLQEFVTAKGDCIDSSERRHPDEVELDQNGELLYALEQYIHWTGDMDLVHKHWDRIVALVEFPLSHIFQHEPSGLMANVREYWERHHMHGILKGMELAYQLFVFIGLLSAAVLAEKLGKTHLASRWQQEANRLKRALLNDTAFGLVQEGRFIKRRGIDGSVHSLIHALPGAGLPIGSPLATAGDHWIMPDTTMALPVAFEFIPADSDLAIQSLSTLEALWNQSWIDGGYGRYHSSSEPDAYGGWPFPSLFVGRAYLEAQDYAKVWRILRWLESVPGAKAGSWPEFYGASHSPPFPQIGFPPWTWTEMLLLLVHHMLGIRPGPDGLHIRPRLLPELDSIEAYFPLRQGGLDLKITRDRNNSPGFIANAKILKQNAEYALIEYSQKNICVEVYI